jgi:predicted Zn finger-like uncharacterized protein
MFTVCPKCALTLVVTAADLRVAQGYVRCGRCSSVFNALARLADDRQASGLGADAAPAASDLPAASVAEEDAPAEESAPEPEPQAPEEPAEAGASTDPAADAAEEEALPDSALEFDPSRTDVSSVFVEQPPDPGWTAATGSFKAMVAANQEAAGEEPRDAQVEVEIDADFLAAMLTAEPPSSSPATEPAPASATPAKPPAPSAAPRAPAPRPAAADAAPVRESARPSHSAPHARPPFEAAAKSAALHVPALRPSPPPLPPPSDLHEDEEQEQEDQTTTQAQPPWRSRLEPLAWPAACGLALLVLFAQIVNHYRDDLAVNPRFSRPLTALYASLGVHLAPRWDLRAYDVRQLGADVDPSGTITVRASIKNAAQQPQPLPLLRVTLQDRFGNRIASSDVAPRSYLPRSIPASSFLSAGQRIDAQMGFVDPGASAVGFELDACLPASAGGIACANDSSTR